jgi:copper chaperone NosL
MKIIATLFFMLTLVGCSTEPVPLRYGSDACQHCRMTLMDQRFGAEVVTTKGKIYTFDDVNCLTQFLSSGIVHERDVAYKLVTDFAAPGTLSDATIAFYVKAPSIKSPMASQVAAFANYDSMEKFKNEQKGIYLTWGELVTQFK